jgi:hypothetical protein
MHDTEPEDVDEQNDDTVFKIPAEMFEKDPIGKLY